MIPRHFEHLVQPLIEFIKSLANQSREKLENVNLVTNVQHIFLSTDELKNQKNSQENIMPIDLYIKHVLIPRAEDEIKNQNREEEMLIKHFEEFETNIVNQIRNIKNLMMEISYEVESRKASTFLNDFSNGALLDENKFIKSLQNTIAYTVTSSETKASKFSRISKLLKKFDQPLKEVENELMLEKKILNMTDCIIPHSFELIGRVEINKDKYIPYTNGIDIHPNKNVYVAMGCENGDLVMMDQDTNEEINRVKISNNSSRSVQNCLWSPSGDKIMVSTKKNASIYIYDEVGLKLLKAIEKTYPKDGYGAIWLSEQEVAVGYVDGIVKFFNINEGKEINHIKIDGNCPWGMDCIDYAHLLVGDYDGSISNIDWKNNKIEWIKKDWHMCGSYISCLRLNHDKTRLLTSSFDFYVKLMKLEDQSKLWEFKLNHYVDGILWVPGELYVLALSYNNKLVALNSNDGTKMIEFNGLSTNSMSLRLNPRNAEVLVGNENGIIQILKIHQVQIKQGVTQELLIFAQTYLYNNK